MEGDPTDAGYSNGFFTRHLTIEKANSWLPFIGSFSFFKNKNKNKKLNTFQKQNEI